MKKRLDKVWHKGYSDIKRQRMCQKTSKEANMKDMNFLVRLFINLMIGAALVNAIWLVASCSIKVRPLNRAEGPGFEISLSRSEPKYNIYGSDKLIIEEVDRWTKKKY